MNRSSAKQRGFTLIELLVVIVIIAVLAALISVAVAGAIGRAKEARIKMELDNIAGAMEQYKAKYGSYPPFHVTTNTADTLKNHVRSLFPRALPGDINTIPNTLSAAEILWFCIRGYTSDPQRPVDFFNESAKRDGSFQFEQGRLVQTRRFDHNPQTMTPLHPSNQRRSPQPVYAYVPQVDAGKEAAYVYFDCSRRYEAQKQSFTGRSGVARPYRTGDGIFANAGKFQIISAGLDGDYGGDVARPRDETTHKYFPNGDNYTEGDKDNLTNFSERNLENSKP
jgi:prepilin-type N-terminal cleavage/methylation domain-containing protein